MNWDTPPKPAELAESRLIEAILEGQFPIGSTLPAGPERVAISSSHHAASQSSRARFGTRPNSRTL